LLFGQTCICSGTQIDLPRAPCANGVIKLGSQIYYRGEQTFTVERLYCDILKKKAMVDVVCCDAPDVFMRLPALLVHLVDTSKDVRFFPIRKLQKKLPH
jgi:hypothetical protein